MTAKLRISAGHVTCPPELADCGHSQKQEIPHQEYHEGCSPTFQLWRTLLKD